MLPSTNFRPAPIIILLAPQLPDNLGAVARVMKNFGLYALRVIKPQCDLLDKKAIAVARGADDLLSQATQYADLTSALADITGVWATCAVQRGGIKPYLTPEAAMKEILHYPNPAIIFGPECSGLDNEILSRSKGVIQIPTRPQFSSLNLSQSVALIAYEWCKHITTAPPRKLLKGKTRMAKEAEVEGFLAHLEAELDKVNYWRLPFKKRLMWRTIKNMFVRLDLTDQEVRTLHGVIKALTQIN